MFSRSATCSEHIPQRREGCSSDAPALSIDQNHDTENVPHQHENHYKQQSLNQDLGLRILADLLHWDDAHARSEYKWLRVMSDLKYDGYQDFVAGKRFVESLIIWLKQFQSLEQRVVAYQFVRTRMTYFGQAELQHLVRLTYPEHVEKRLVTEVASRLKVQPYEVRQSNILRRALDRLRRSTLFVALSDGARIDVFRRANVGLISNEQVVPIHRFSNSKWLDLARDLQKELADPTARFDLVVLLDDFVGSGTSLLRKDHATDRWGGKLSKFYREAAMNGGDVLAKDCPIMVHHYVASHEGRQRVVATERERATDTREAWFRSLSFSFGMVLPQSFKMQNPGDQAFLHLIDEYYDGSIETEHFEIGGAGAKLGFASGALPLVLEHNTPNNSVALLWAESEGSSTAHRMRPLFRRRQRHS